MTRPAVSPLAGHHPPGAILIGRTTRDPNWFARKWREHLCRKSLGHCYHAAGFVDWWCCECGGYTDGMPPQRCLLCQPAASVTS